MEVLFYNNNFFISLVEDYKFFLKLEIGFLEISENCLSMYKYVKK